MPQSDIDPAKEWIQIGDLRVESRILDSWPITRCWLNECRGKCCGHGVHLDLADAQRIMDEAHLVKPHLPSDRHNVDDWFDGDVGEDRDFPTGWRVGTQVIKDSVNPSGTRCVFLRPDGFCALQVTSIAEGRHPWDLKPFYCRLFPMILLDDRIEFDDENEIYKLGGNCCRPATPPVPLYETYKEELVMLLGELGYQQLCQIAQIRREKQK